MSQFLNRSINVLIEFSRLENVDNLSQHFVDVMREILHLFEVFLSLSVPAYSAVQQSIVEEISDPKERRILLCSDSRTFGQAISGQSNVVLINNST
jgi:hypothetical protein